MDCYSTVLYETVWLDRNNHTFNTIIEDENINIPRSQEENNEIEERCKALKQQRTQEYAQITRTRQQTTLDAVRNRVRVTPTPTLKKPHNRQKRTSIKGNGKIPHTQKKQQGKG